MNKSVDSDKCQPVLLPMQLCSNFFSSTTSRNEEFCNSWHTVH